MQDAADQAVAELAQGGGLPCVPQPRVLTYQRLPEPSLPQPTRQDSLATGPDGAGRTAVVADDCPRSRTRADAADEAPRTYIRELRVHSHHAEVNDKPVLPA